MKKNKVISISDFEEALELEFLIEKKSFMSQSMCLFFNGKGCDKNFVNLDVIVENIME